METQFVIDCGSRSIKLHEAARGAVSLQATRSWDPINDARNVARVGQLLADLTKGLPSVSAIHVVGTAAARRDPDVAQAINAACAALGWTYETLSHQKEAGLILDAFGGADGRDIINVGGGSIQIVRPSGEATLLGFGISDLNRHFGLAEAPALRQVDAAHQFVLDALPSMPRPFIYSGGELSYLIALGARLGAEGRCSTAEFERVSSFVDATGLDALEPYSPYDAGWIKGAVASNVIVRACLEKGGLDHYYASDVNIADGIISGLAGRAPDATDTGL
jgi:hypothetical protein